MFDVYDEFGEYVDTVRTRKEAKKLAEKKGGFYAEQDDLPETFEELMEEEEELY